eukprot:3206325-Alexandrium_andersonii.AAC.1
MEQQPPVGASDSSDDPPVVPLNLPVDGSMPVFTGESTKPANPWRSEFFDRTSGLGRGGRTGPVPLRRPPTRQPVRRMASTGRSRRRPHRAPPFRGCSGRRGGRGRFCLLLRQSASRSRAGWLRPCAGRLRS